MWQKLLSPRVVMSAGGLLFGILAALLTELGNPPNMGFCTACFMRDISGSLGLHRAELVQYLRPEILGLVFGAFVSAYIFKEFQPRGGSSPIIRFFLGVFMMVGALVFLGCTVRAPLRLAGGDLNAMTGLVGLVAGILAGIMFLKRGYNLGRASRVSTLSGLIMPMAFLALLVFLIFKPVFLLFSQKGLGSLFAPVAPALLGGLVIGFIAQKTRMCFAGGWRDVILVRDFHLVSGIWAFFLGALIANYALGNFSSGLYKWGFADQPVAHANHLWNFLGMTLVGLSATLLGGCPLRQAIMSAEGNTDAAAVVLGLFAGAALSHNFLLASSSKGTGLFGPTAVIIGLLFCMAVGYIMSKKEN